MDNDRREMKDSIHELPPSPSVFLVDKLLFLFVANYNQAENDRMLDQKQNSHINLMGLRHFYVNKMPTVVKVSIGSYQNLLDESGPIWIH